VRELILRLLVKNLEFDPIAFENFAWWIEQDRNRAIKIIKLIREIQRNPYSGRGEPEPLKHELAGCWSRRIDQEHRLVEMVGNASLLPTLQNELK